MIPHLCPFKLEIKMAEREGNSDSQELEDFISAQKSSNTVKKTKSDIRALKRFCSTVDETRELCIFRIMLHGICEKPSKLSSVV